MKKLLSLFLVIAVIFSVCLLPNSVSAARVDNLNYTFKTTSGSTISTKGYGKKATILIFGKTDCLNGIDTLESLGKSDWADNSVIRTIFAEYNKSTLSQVKAFQNSVNNKNVTYCYDTGSTIENAMVSYLRAFDPDKYRFNLPLIVLIDGNNKCREIMYGKQTEAIILDKIKTFTRFEGDDTNPVVSVRLTGKSNYDYAKKVVELANQQRKAAGLSALKIDSNLMKIAMKRAAEIAVCYSHTRPNDYPCSSASTRGKYKGENIAMGYGTPQAVMTGWMNSLGHKANIMNPDTTNIGVGCFLDDEGTYHWVQFFDNASADQTTKSGIITTTYTIDVRSSNLSLSSGGTVKYNCGDKKSQKMEIIQGESTGWGIALDASNFTYKSSNTKAFTVSATGVVKKVGTGKATITATLKNNSNIKVKQNFEAAAHDNTFNIVKATIYSNGRTYRQCKKCGTKQLTSTIYKPYSIKLSKTSYKYDGKIKTPIVSIKTIKGKVLKSGTDYTVSYPKGRREKGKYGIKITFKGIYKGTKTLYFTIK